MKVRAFCESSIFSAMEVADCFVRVGFAEAFNEQLKVFPVERPVAWHVIAIGELFGVAFVGVSISEGNKAAVFVQTSLMNDPHSPHERPIKTAAKTLAASNR